MFCPLFVLCKLVDTGRSLNLTLVKTLPLFEYGLNKHFFLPSELHPITVSMLCLFES